MLKLIALPGQNKRNYIKVIAETIPDLEDFKHLKAIVSRTEYKPFSKGFNKNVSESYLIDETYIPAQFWQDIRTKLQPIIPYKLEIENDHIFYFNDLKRDFFTEYMETLVLPEKYNIFAEAYSYQMESVFRALLFKTARIEVGTSGGKTLITYLYCRFLIDNIIPKDKKVLIIVPRQILAKQAQKDFIEYDQFNDIPLKVETIFSGSKRILESNIVIGTYQSLKEYDESYFDDFSAIICDEVQSAKIYSIKNEIYSKCREADFFFGMTGSYPKYQTLDYLSIVAMFGPLVFVKKTHELIKDGNATPVFINKIKIRYNEEYSNFSKNLLEGGFSGVEKYRIEKKFFQTYEPRNKLITKLINNFEGNHLILVETVEYCKDLMTYIGELCPDHYVDIIHGSVKGRDEIIELMKTKYNMILIATYETMSTGVSIPTIAHIHFPDGGRSEIRIKQSVGRGLRLHELKKLLNVWDYQDEMLRSSFKNHAKERNLIYTEEKHPSKEFNVLI